VRGVLESEREASLSPTRIVRILASLAVLGLACGCGSSTPAANTISISNYQFSPANLSVKPGTTVSIANEDPMQHSVTSQTQLGMYVAGAVGGVSFDTGAFEGSTSFVIPSTASAGTVIPYFCTVHTNTMGMGQGQITIVPP
jgi:plastocyanin